MYGDGFQEQRLWDKHGRPTTTAYRSPTNALVRSQQLAYDLAENVASKVEATQVGSFTESYGYDALNRLTSSYGAGLPSKVYQYNAIGNLTFKTGAGNYTYRSAGYDAFAVNPESGMPSARGRDAPRKACRWLLDRHTLRQVPRLVHIRPPREGCVVRE
ncbi:MAG: hypothetical protein M9951_07285 [Burkholderiaceae bacterium]|nr:hypothetical protein [Burkholderiaceae bacterium]